MRRVISLFLPRSPSDRLRRKSKDFPSRDKPLVTVVMLGPRRVLASVDEAAEGLGLRCGMTVTHAQSLVPHFALADATPEAEEEALIRLALWCVKYSPLGRLIRRVVCSSTWPDRRICFKGKQPCSRSSVSVSLPKVLPHGRGWPIRRAAPGPSHALATEVSSRRAAPPKRLPACRSSRCGFPMMSYHLSTTWVSSASRNSPASRAKPEPPARQQRVAASRSGAGVAAGSPAVPDPAGSAARGTALCRAGRRPRGSETHHRHAVLFVDRGPDT